MKMIVVLKRKSLKDVKEFLTDCDKRPKNDTLGVMLFENISCQVASIGHGQEEEVSFVLDSYDTEFPGMSKLLVEACVQVGAQ